VELRGVEPLASRVRF